MKEHRQYPKMIFNSGNSAWMRQPLHACGIFNPSSTLPEEFEYVDLESVVGTVLCAHRKENLLTAPSRAQRLAQKYDIFYQMVRPYQKNNYLFDKDEKNYVFSTGYAQIRPSIDERFLFSFMQKDSFVDEVLMKSTGSSYPAISSSALANIEIYVPSDCKEQKKIGQYFKHIDDQISYTDKELQKLRQLKAACLQAMFPQEGETVPRLRFKGFEGEWKKVKLGDIGYTYSGLTGKNKDDFGIGQAHFITFLNVLNNYVINPYEFQPVNVDSSENQNKVRKGDLFFNTSSETPEEVGMCSVLTQDYNNLYLNSFCFGFRLSVNNYNPLFLACMMRSSIGRDVMKVLAQGATRYNLSKTNFLNTSLLLPSSLAEQTKIASFFQNLDKQIKLTEKKLEKLKQIKVSCLDLMFV